MPVYIGVDPGASGGLVALSSDGSKGRVESVSMPETERDVWEWFKKRSGDGVFAVVERVSGFAGKGKGGQPGSAMFKFGFSAGSLWMALTAAEIPFEAITPQKWQKALGISPRKKHDKTIKVIAKRGKRKGRLIDKKVGGETDSEWKGRLRSHAQKLFPGIDITLDVADAVLIAEYCRRSREGRL